MIFINAVLGLIKYILICIISIPGSLVFILAFFLRIILAIIFGPIIGLVCLPIFGVKARSHWLEYKRLYEKTLFQGTRKNFGRVPGQDYTRWNGKALSLNKMPSNRQQERKGIYCHGFDEADFRFMEKSVKSAFNSMEDLEWLEHEYISRKAKAVLDWDLIRLRASAIALIPIFGAIWVLLTESDIGGAIYSPPRSLPNPGYYFPKAHREILDTHWTWKQAIDFHIQNLKKTAY